MQLNPAKWQLKHSQLLAISGAVWLCIGTFLLNLGINFIMRGWTFVGFSSDGYSSLFLKLSALIGDNGSTCATLIAFAMLLGYVKGNFVMKKTALGTFTRISALPNPAPLSKLYTKANYILVAGMMGLGLLMKVSGLTYDIRGFVDTAVGIALIQGAVHHFRFAWTAHKKTTCNGS